MNGNEWIILTCGECDADVSVGTFRSGDLAYCSGCETFGVDVAWHRGHADEIEETD